MKNALANRIKQSGYWQAIIRPSSHIAGRLKVVGDVQNTIQVIRGLSVQLRGWDVPHVDYNAHPQIERDSVGQDTEWNHFHELWRCYSSGQFLYLAGMRHDWGAESILGPAQRVEDGVRILGLGDALFRLTEILKFALAYARSLVKADSVTVHLEVGGLSGRQLVIDSPSRLGFSVPYIATTLRPYHSSVEISEATSVDDVLRMAREQTQALCTLFGNVPNEEVLADWQAKIGRF